jgi:subtilase family serine protease
MFDIKISNSGSFAVDSFFDVFFEIDLDVPPQTQRIQSLGPGESIDTEIVSLSLSGTFPGKGEGACPGWWSETRTFTVTIDPFNDIQECDENNNQKTNTVTP